MFDAAIFPQIFKPGDLVITALAPPRWGGLYDIVYVSGDSTGVASQICADFVRPTT